MKRRSNGFKSTKTVWLDDDALELNLTFWTVVEKEVRYLPNGDPGHPGSTDTELADAELIIHDDNAPDVTVDGIDAVTHALDLRGHDLDSIQYDAQDGIEPDEDDGPDPDDERDRLDGY